MKKPVSPLLFLAPLLMLSCRKSGPQYYEIENEQVKNAVSFKKGSFFIFQDSISKQTDSVWIDTTQASWYDFNQGARQSDALMLERIAYSLKGNHLTSGAVEVIAPEDGSDNYTIKGTIKLKSMTYDRIVPIFFNMNIKQHVKIIFGTGYSMLCNYHPYLVLNGSTHYNIFEVLDERTNQNSPHDKTTLVTFYSLEEGIVKYTLQSSTGYEVWELVYNQINR